MHVVMGIAMAGMLVADLRTLPADWWEVMFGLGAAWFASRMFTPSGHRPTGHLIECGAMLYMLFSVPHLAPHLAPGLAMPATQFSPLVLPLAVYLVGFAIWQTERLTVVAPARVPPARDPRAATDAEAPAFLAPRCAVLCNIAMALTMSCALLLML